jgi:hypothetical protein
MYLIRKSQYEISQKCIQRVLDYVATDVRTDSEKAIVRNGNEQHLIGPEQYDGAAIHVHNVYTTYVSPLAL